MNWIVKVAILTMAMLLVSSCGPAPTAVVPLTVEQACAARGDYVIEAQEIETLYVSSVNVGEKWAKMDMSLVSIKSDCNNDVVFRARFPEIGTKFYSEFTGDQLLSRIVFRFKFTDGTSQDLQFEASNNALVATIRNFKKLDMLESIQPIFLGENGLDLPTMQISITNGNVGMFVEQIRIEYMSMSDWFVTPSETPGGCTVDPLSTPLPPCPTATPKFGWLLDFLGTPQPLPTITPTPSVTPTPSITPSGP